MSTFSSPFHRDRLMRTKQYLGSSTFLSSVHWAKTGNSHILTEVLPDPEGPEGPAAPDAIVMVVGTVADTQFKTTTVGNYNAHPTEDYKQKRFDQAKYTFLIIAPKSDPTFAPDFPLFILALKKLQNSISRTKINKWLISKDGDDDAIRFSFNVFEPKTSLNSETDIATWPVPSECREHLQNITDSHVIREFKVFDVDGSLVEPSDIPSKLVGALVECSFGILHYSFGTDDSFSGIINQVVILRPAPLKLASPFKGTKKAYRPPPLSPEDVHAREQLAVNAFTQPISRPGPSNIGPLNLPVPLKRPASTEPEGTVTKRPNLTESPAIVHTNPNDDSGKEKGKGKAPETTNNDSNAKKATS
ncbi:hypothetical protein DFH06DRAFT_1379351 [Mycena polygramma]|nr:hypothetical protein DFH06DRAFT_1379351 [Mycena polygramma]